MSNMNDISPEKLDQMLKLAGKKMGTDPNKLKQQLETGAFDDVIKNMGPNQAAAVSQLMNNPKALEQLLNTPKAKELLRNMMGGK